MILRYCFYPWLLYFFVSLVYCYEFMAQDLIIPSSEQPDDRIFDCGVFYKGNMSCETFDGLEIFVRSLLMVLCVHQIIMKVFQSRFSKRQTLNVLDIVGMSINLIALLIITLEKAGADLGLTMYGIRVMASFVTVQLWVQMFYWLRLFDRTARYIDLIIDTVRDIGIFALILLLLLILFASGIYMIQLNRMHFAGDETQYLFDYDQDTGLNMVIEALLYQY